MQWLRQLLARPKPHIPTGLWQDCLARLPFLQRLSAADRDRLKAICETLLDRKTFTGAAEFTLTNETAVMIAAQAALPVLNLDLSLYDDIAGIIVYPAEFVVPQVEIDDAGVVHEWREPVSGEAIDAGGAVVLSWEDIGSGGSPGYNVVIHEFVHKIDMADGYANGCPPLLPMHRRDITAEDWQRTFRNAYADFCRRVDELDRHDNDSANFNPQETWNALPLDPYAATNPAEFFAVASEAFFVWPAPLRNDYPEIHYLLEKYYRQTTL